MPLAPLCGKPRTPAGGCESVARTNRGRLNGEHPHPTLPHKRGMEPGGKISDALARVVELVDTQL